MAPSLQRQRVAVQRGWPTWTIRRHLSSETLGHVVTPHLTPWALRNNTWAAPGEAALGDLSGRHSVFHLMDLPVQLRSNRQARCERTTGTMAAGPPASLDLLRETLRQRDAAPRGVRPEHVASAVPTVLATASWTPRFVRNESRRFAHNWPNRHLHTARQMEGLKTVALKLSLRETGWSREDVHTIKQHPIAYEVVGLPLSHRAQIYQFGTRWKIMYHKGFGTYAEWEGDYESKDAALAVISSRVYS